MPPFSHGSKVMVKKQKGIKLKGLQRFVSYGIQYTYHRPSGIRLEPPHVYGSPEFLAAYLDADRKHKRGETPRVIKRKVTRPDNWAKVVDAFLDSPEFAARSERTQKDYRAKLDILDVLGDRSLTWFNTPRIIEIRDKLAKERGRRTADYCVTVMSVVFKYAKERGMVKDNPAAGIKELPRGADEGEANMPWLPEEVRALVENLPPHISRPVIFAAMTGVRIGDLVKLKADAVRDGVIRIKTSKTGAPVAFDWPAPFGDPPAAGALFPNSRGKAWTDNGLRVVVFRIRDLLVEAGKLRPGLTFHGLRTTFAQAAANRGFDMRAIADAMGHAQTQTTEIYVRNAAKEKNSRKVTKAIGGAVLGALKRTTETDSVNLPKTKIVKEKLSKSPKGKSEAAK